MKKIIAIILTITVILCLFTACSIDASVNDSRTDAKNTIDIGNKLAENQPTPTDIDYSLERYNLIRRAYWVNGQREKADALVCEVEKPLGYIVLFAGNTAVGNFVVDGKVSSLNSFLTPDSEFYEKTTSNYIDNGIVKYNNNWLPDVDGSYGLNDNGIFFFTPDGNYHEWTGEYHYSDVPYEVENPILKVRVENE